MNVITKNKIVIEFDIWEPFKKESIEDLDALIAMIKGGKVLTHCGNVHLHYEELGDVKQLDKGE